MNPLHILRIFVLALFTVLSFGSVSAQTAIGLPYFNSFEDPAENSLWTLRSGDECTDRWYIGDATRYDGDSSLYISSVGKDSLKYGTDKNVVVAYRRLSVSQAGSYDVIFDWRNKVEDAKSGLFVAVYSAVGGKVPESVKGDIVPPPLIDVAIKSISLLMPDGVTRGNRLAGDGAWYPTSFSYRFSANEDYYLVFVWVNNESATGVTNIGAAVDNIQIALSSTKSPYNLSVSSKCDTAELLWHSPASLFDISYRRSGTDSWSVIRNVASASGSMAHTYAVSDLGEGIYDFKIRSVVPVGASDTAYSVYVHKNTNLVFCPENHCINYIDLNSEHVTCLVGTASPDPALSASKPIDYTYKDVYSRHTVHWIYGEKDPRTNYKLRTVPENEFASVRIGNWNNGKEADGIEYTIPVSPDMSVLLLKYAIVFQDPFHDKEEQPFFSLELFDENHKPIEGDCGKAAFYADSRDTTWNKEGSDQNVIVWKDWTTVGFNLSNHIGKNVIVRLITQDCTLGGHYGYAYFTLGCSSGEIKGITCGDSPTMDLKAPDGFDYAWFRSDDLSDTVHTEQIYTVDTDNDTEYICHVLFRDKDPSKQGCKFELSTKAYARIPFADCTWQHVPDSCFNRIRLIDSSRVMTYNDDRTSLIPTDERDSCVVWTVNGKEYTKFDPVIDVPLEGGKLSGTLRSTIVGGCDDDTIFTFDIPSILTPTRSIDTTLCYGETFAYCDPVRIFGVTGDTILRCELTNRYGCDSITVINVHCHPRSPRTVIDTTICFGTSFTDWHTPLTTDGTYRDTFPNRYGCDSIVVVNLTVASEVLFDITTKDVMSQPHSGEIGIIPDASLPEFTYTINDEPGGALTGLDAGRYHITVFDSLGCSRDTVVELFAEYLSVSVSDGIYACSGDDSIAIPYTVLKGYSPAYHITFDTVGYNAGFAKVDSSALFPDHITLPLPSLCRPNHYTAYITFYDIMGRDQMHPVLFTVRYDSMEIRQKWDDVFAVLNERHNSGSFRFDAFRWYRNDIPIPDANSSYYYLSDSEFDLTDTYYVELRRAGETAFIPTCPIHPTSHTDITSLPMLMQTRTTPSSRIEVRNAPSHATVRIYDLRGILWNEQPLLDGYILTPSERGAYIVVIITPEHRYTEKIMVY